ncbi:MAG: bifunctional DNA-formamidopyrimidine glycosylase/DNA-(apurinic or apyrimidinic site) lyase [Moraxellaceae bacterium]|nr:bifunctional DNA-formamidopyrimidine glycosylase/DNA-(apurinic or apyrimidinic site) lyase [Moraxellaceae bacterium]MDZ4386187.1 bifunctional DNA-formamidopyrimidine glycosylase/DNA-(apurinic or apyrimidinic site) lyase [Moraxellaceae bacterium]
MPELPEVETTRRGISPWLVGRQFGQLRIRNGRLRWLVPEHLPTTLAGLHITSVERRAKYLLIHTDKGALLLHLGMSGSLRLCSPETPLKTHDHLIWSISGTPNQELRFHDPRRFGCCLWLTENPAEHALLKSLGPEPLSTDFNDEHLFRLSRGKTTPIKSFLMDNHVVVGVGNIYANEALFQVGIHPLRPAGRISAERYRQLSAAVRSILAAAITQGGTTLRDFVNGNGEPGYFQQTLAVYGRAGLPCTTCQRPLKEVRVNARSTVYCGFCQR